MERKNNSSFYRKLFSSKYGCYLTPFAILLCYFLFFLVRSGKPNPSGYYIIHYLYTYDHGFVARGLLGEIISWFYETVSDELISNITTVFSFLLVVFSSLCIGKAFYKVKNDRERLVWVSFLSIIMCAMPAFLGLHFEAFHLDKILWVLALCSVFISDRKLAVWLVPVLCIIATLINPLFLFSSMILIAIVLLQQFHTDKYSFKRLLICLISYISMIALGIYSPISEKLLGFSTPQEFLEFYFSRYSGTLKPETYNGFINEWLFDYFQPMDEILKSSFNYYFIGLSWGQKCFFYFLLVVLPAYLLLGNIWKNAIKNEDNKFQKFIYFLCLISPIVIIPPLILGWELPRYFTDNFIVQLSLLIYFIVKGHPSVLNAVHKFVNYLKENVIIAVIGVLYFVSVIVM